MTGVQTCALPISASERELIGRKTASVIAVDRLQADAESASRRTEFLAESRAAAAAALNRIRDLRDLDAANANEVRSAEEVLRMAQHVAIDAQADAERMTEQASAGYKAAQQDIAANEAAVAGAQRAVTALEKAYEVARELRNHEKERGIANIRSRVVALEARTSHLRALAGPTEVRALADGVITEVVVTEGSKIPTDGMIMSMTGTGKSWVTAFVPPNRAKDIVLGHEVSIYPTTDNQPIVGKITAGGGIQHKVPPVLRDYISDASAVYVRIDLDPNATMLIPGNIVRVVMRLR